MSLFPLRQGIQVITRPEGVVEGRDAADALAEGRATERATSIVERAQNADEEFPKPRLRADTVSDFLKIVIPPREMILAPFLPTQGLVELYAKTGIGKTHLALGIAYAVATGGTFLKWKALKARKVLFIDGEMPGAAMQERLARIVAAGAEEQSELDFLRIVTPDRQEDGIPDLATPEGQGAIEEAVGDAELVILDNLSCLFPSVNENGADGWAPIQTWLLGLRRRGVSVLFVHHAGKGGDQRGTSRREDVLDTAISLERPGDYQASEGARFEVRYTKSRGFTGADARPFEAKLEIRDGVAVWTMKDVEDSRAEQVAELLDGGLKQKDIAEKLGIDPSNVSRHAKIARELGLVRVKEGG